MRTHDFPTRHYWGTVVLDKSSPRKFSATIWEVDPPFRISHARIFRLAKAGLVLGRWSAEGAEDPDSHLSAATRSAFREGHVVSHE